MLAGLRVTWLANEVIHKDSSFHHRHLQIHRLIVFSWKQSKSKQLILNTCKMSTAKNGLSRRNPQRSISPLSWCAMLCFCSFFPSHHFFFVLFFSPLRQQNDVNKSNCSVLGSLLPQTSKARELQQKWIFFDKATSPLKCPKIPHYAQPTFPHYWDLIIIPKHWFKFRLLLF